MNLEHYFLLFFRNSVVMSIVILCLFLSGKWLLSRYKAKSLYTLWIVVLLGLLLPVRFSVQADLLQSIIPQNRMASEEIISVEADPPETYVLGEPIAARTTGSKSTIQLITNMGWKQMATILWISGAVVFLAVSLGKHICLMRQLHRWRQPVEIPEVLSTYRESAREIGMCVLPRLYVCKFISSPMGAGIYRPGIYLPSTEFEESDLRLLLSHELIHYKRKDIFYKLLILLASALHWYNPFVCLMRKEVACLCEISCDESVIQAIGEQHRKSYGMMILSVMEHSMGKARQTPLSTQFSSGKADALQRLSAILSKKHKGTCLTLLVLLVVFTLCTGMVVSDPSPVLYIQPNDAITSFSTGAPGEREFYYTITGTNNISSIVAETATETTVESTVIYTTKPSGKLPEVGIPFNPNTPEANVQIRSILEQQVSGAIFTFADGSQKIYELNVPGANELSSGFIASINSATGDRMAYYGAMEVVDSSPTEDSRYDLNSQNTVVEVTLDCLPNTVEADRARREFFADEYNKTGIFNFSDGTRFTYILETNVPQGAFIQSDTSQQFTPEEAMENGYDFVEIAAVPGTAKARQLENANMSRRKWVIFQYADRSQKLGRVIRAKGSTLLEGELPL